MAFDDPGPARERETPRPDDGESGDPDTPGESLIVEIRAAADAAASQVRAIAATASTEARISVSSLIWMASAMMLSVALLIMAWSSLVGIGIWLAIDSGWSVTGALFAAAAANIAAAALCRLWYVRLSRNIGFPRTLSLLLGPVDDPVDDRRRPPP